MSRGWRCTVAAAGLLAVADGATAAAVEAPRVVYLFYADGVTPAGGTNCPGTPPAYTCSFGGAEGVVGCQKAVQAILDGYYADFNVVFTLQKPTSGSYYTVAISSNGDYCGMTIGGYAPAKPDCSDFNGNTCYVFKCADSAKICASLIAQEHGHLVGLVHTNSSADTMNPVVSPMTIGFENKDNPTQGSNCRATQNSYLLMLSRLGMWPGGPKPGPFSPWPSDGGADGPADATGMGGAAGAGGAGGAGGTGASMMDAGTMNDGRGQRVSAPGGCTIGADGEASFDTRGSLLWVAALLAFFRSRSGLGMPATDTRRPVPACRSPSR